jgi:hypothetical protein
MLASPFTAWLRPASTVAALAAMLVLTACGGGSGAPNNPYAPQPPAPLALSVIPAEAIAYAGTPLVLAITGGTAPYQAISANPAALPVPTNVTGDTLTLLANNVDSEQPANVTIRDAVGAAVTASITVRPSVLLPASLTIVRNGAPCPGGDLCSGQTGSATVRVTGPAGVPLAGRQVRFEVVQGQFALQTTDPASPLASTQTVASDANGEARVIVAVPPTTATQIGLLRATELATGSQVTAQFVIAQVTSGEGVLSIAPTGKTTITGADKLTCSSGVRVSHYIFGGTPPYRVVVNFPDVVTLVGSPVTQNGGGFDVITRGACFEGLSFAITDATGRTLSGAATVDNVPGSEEPATPPEPVADLQVTPSTFGSSAAPLSCAGRTFAVTVTGKNSFSAASSNATTILTWTAPAPNSSPAQLLVSNVPAGGSTTIRIGDSNTPQQIKSVTIYCQ